MIKTFLGKNIPIDTKGILYLCKYNGTSIKVLEEIFFNKEFDALNAYANIPNPESQLMIGKTYGRLVAEVDKCNDNLENPQWIKQLGEYL